MNYSGISECDVLNGTGFRVVLFVSGCNHRCYNCQNPKTWNENFGHPFTEKTKEYLFECLSKDYIDGITITGGDPLYEKNLDGILSLLNEIRSKYPKISNFEKVDAQKPHKMGILEPEKGQEIRLSLPEKNIWLYTGYKLFVDYPKSHRQHKTIISTLPNASTNPIYDNELYLKKKEEDRKRSEIISLCDVVVDGRYIDEQRDVTLKWKGSKNQKVIDIKQTLAQNKIVLYCD